jgi:hypothetical protein
MLLYYISGEAGVFWRNTEGNLMKHIQHTLNRVILFETGVMLCGYSEVSLAVTMLCQLYTVPYWRAWLAMSVVPTVHNIDTRHVTVILSVLNTTWACIIPLWYDILRIDLPCWKAVCLRKYFDFKKEKLMGDERKFYCELHSSYFSQNNKVNCQTVKFWCTVRSCAYLWDRLCEDILLSPFFMKDLT